jgi:nuclear transport factor 2 (NTF2) superfamily protein/thiaminase
MDSRRNFLVSKVFDTNASLWAKASKEHPFLQGIVTGAVTTAQFDTWLVQDFKYVHHFLSFLQKVLGNASTTNDQVILQGGVATVTNELVWFQGMAKQRNTDLNVPTLPHTDKYGAFMAKMGNECYAIQLVVMYLVEKCYCDAWCHVLAQGGADGPYAQFAVQWSSREFQMYVEQLGNMAVVAGMETPLDQHEWEQQISNLFVEIMKLECDFWEMAFQSSSVPKEAPRPPLPPFTYETAVQKVRMAEDAWNSRDPHRVSLAYTPDTVWRNRSTFLKGREAVVTFLQDKWSVESDYRLVKEIWCHSDHHIAVRFCYEWHDESNNWFRSHGNENWEFDALGYMKTRHASINDVPIKVSNLIQLFTLFLFLNLTLTLTLTQLSTGNTNNNKNNNLTLIVPPFLSYQGGRS